MANISDTIEEFILNAINDDSLSISRNELADFFNVSPSQINYVLSTRFTYARGFVTESRRGGGGYVKILKVTPTKDVYLHNILINELKESIDYPKSLQILDNLVSRALIDDKTYKVIKSAICPKSLKMPIAYEDEMRAKILRNILTNL